MRQIKLGVDAWFLVRFETALGVGITGIAFSDGSLSAILSKNASSGSAMALAAGDWQEHARGYYWVRVSAARNDTLGAGAVIVTYQSVDQGREFFVMSALADDVKTDTAGLVTTMSSAVSTLAVIRGLMGADSYEDTFVYGGPSGALSSSRLRTYNSSANATTHGVTGLLKTYTMTFGYTVSDLTSVLISES